jgi:hypothetical protein
MYRHLSWRSGQAAHLGRNRFGSGQGSVPARDIVAELPAIATEITGGRFQLDARAVALVDVESARTGTDGDQRIVITPYWPRRADT